MINKLCGTRPIKPNKRMQNPGWQSQIAGFRRSKFDIHRSAPKGWECGRNWPAAIWKWKEDNGEFWCTRIRAEAHFKSINLISIIPHKFVYMKGCLAIQSVSLHTSALDPFTQRSAPLSSHSVRSLIVAMATIWDLRRRDEWWLRWVQRKKSGKNQLLSVNQSVGVWEESVGSGT